MFGKFSVLSWTSGNRNRRGSKCTRTSLLPSTTGPSPCWTASWPWTRRWSYNTLQRPRNRARSGSQRPAWLRKGAGQHQSDQTDGPGIFQLVGIIYTILSPRVLPSAPPTPSRPWASSWIILRKRALPWPSISGGSSGTMCQAIWPPAWRSGWQRTWSSCWSIHSIHQPIFTC
jgi:hypothetical protein